MENSFGSQSVLELNNKNYEYYKLDAIEDNKVKLLPYSLKILLENLLRFEDGVNITKDDILAVVNWEPTAKPTKEISFTPARVILQDFTGVPAVVDLAAMRNAVINLGGDANSINPLSPAELVIDHSVQVDNYAKSNALALNNEIEFNRNEERYSFLKWGQNAFENFKVVPPNTGIVHQVNLEYLSRVTFDKKMDDKNIIYPDTVVGTDSHTTMINGLGILGWGVGGIEAEAAMLGQPITMLIPQVVGFKLTGKLREGTTATDLVLTVTEILREKGVVGKFVEFFGDGLDELPLADRATLGNMSPEFGSTCAIFPIDNETLRYLELSGREKEHIELIEAYSKVQGLWREKGQTEANYSDLVELDMSNVVPSIAGPKRPQDRIPLKQAHKTFDQHLKIAIKDRTSNGNIDVKIENDTISMKDGALLIAAITSCTNTSNPAVMIAAGLLAQNAIKLGLKTKPWVKTSLAPGSKVVTDYLKKAKLNEALDQLGFQTVGYGCTTCIGNSGPLMNEISKGVYDSELIGCSILSGNRNFEGRIHPQVQMNFLASPPLVVAYAIAGNMQHNLTDEPLGKDQNGNAVYLKDIWPSQKDVSNTLVSSINSDMFSSSYDSVFDGDENWNNINTSTGEIYGWDKNSTYVKHPPYFEGMTLTPDPINKIKDARVLALLGDSVTTDHISPAGGIAKDSPAAEYLRDQGVLEQDFNSYGSRRGNHEVMMRGTFANIRLRNKLAPGTEGGWTNHQPSNQKMTIFEAANQYKKDHIPLIILAGSEYGTGSSRDWAAKGTLLLGVKAVIAKSYERIHRSNLIGMGVLPLQFKDNEDAESHGLDGTEEYSISDHIDSTNKTAMVHARCASGEVKEFETQIRIDTPKERDYFEHGGILQFVLRQIITSK
jgi:aconitate hydratase|tara:strand:- start:10905 stop:13574 length:2670 start_codon:yes stop_codon:yes gene_type:complete